MRASSRHCRDRFRDTEQGKLEAANFSRYLRTQQVRILDGGKETCWRLNRCECLAYII